MLLFMKPKEISEEDFTFFTYGRKKTDQRWIGFEYLSGCKIAKDPFVVDGVTIGMPFNLEDIYNKFGKGIIPDCLGIYHLFMGNKLVYVGMSTSIRKRLMCHLRENLDLFDNCLWFCTAIIDRYNSIEHTRLLEAQMIKKFKPELNIQHRNSN